MLSQSSNRLKISSPPTYKPENHSFKLNNSYQLPLLLKSLNTWQTQSKDHHKRKEFSDFSESWPKSWTLPQSNQTKVPLDTLSLWLTPSWAQCKNLSKLKEKISKTLKMNTKLLNNPSKEDWMKLNTKSLISNNSLPPLTESSSNAKISSPTKEKKSQLKLKSELNYSMNAMLLVLLMLLKDNLEMKRDKLSVRLYNYSKPNLDYSRNTLMKD